MLPEVRVLLERARSARLSLDGLFDVLPADYWSRAEAGSRWDVRDQLAHIASADGMLRDLLRAVASGQPVVWVGGTEDAAELLARREAPLAELVAVANRPANLDSGAGRETMRLLRQIAKGKGRSVVIVSHDQRHDCTTTGTTKVGSPGRLFRYPRRGIPRQTYNRPATTRAIELPPW